MFRYWIPIAHGTLGPLDEVVVVVALVIFVGMMVAPPIITWVRGKQGDETPNELPTPTDAESTSDAPKPAKRTDNTDDHYRLD
jgi:hypothetical protein